MKKITIVMRHGSEPIIAEDIPDSIAGFMAEKFLSGFTGRVRISDERTGSDRMIDMGDIVGMEIENIADDSGSAQPDD